MKDVLRGIIAGTFIGVGILIFVFGTSACSDDDTFINAPVCHNHHHNGHGKGHDKHDHSECYDTPGYNLDSLIFEWAHEVNFINAPDPDAVFPKLLQRPKWGGRQFIRVDGDGGMYIIDTKQKEK